LRNLIRLLGADDTPRRFKMAELIFAGITLILNAINLWNDPAVFQNSSRNSTTNGTTQIPALACELLANTLPILNEKQKSAIVMLGGFEVMAQAAQFLSDPMERAKGIFAVTQLAQGTEANIYTFLVTKLDGAKAVCKAMRVAKHTGMIQKSGSLFLLAASTQIFVLPL
jgi:hypothetical protein